MAMWRSRRRLVSVPARHRTFTSGIMSSMSEPPIPHQESVHDVLAAEAFAMPAPDPSLEDADAHDILAAEEFAMPAPDPTLHHPPVVLPADLTGAAEARDVLAAEEFAMPAPPPHPGGGVARGAR